MVPGRLVRRDRRRRRPHDEVLRPGDGCLAGRVRPAHRDERLLRTPGRAPGLRRQGRRRGAAVPVPRLAVEPRGPQRLHPVPGSPQPRPADPHLSRRGAQRVGLHLARRRGSRAVLRCAGRVRRLRRRQQRGGLLPAAEVVPREPGTASAVRARKRGGLRPFQVRAQHPDRAGLHPPRLRRAGVLRRLHHHLRRRRRPEDRGRQQRRGGDQRRPGHRGDQELGHDRQPHHLRDHPGRRVHLRRPVHGLHRPYAGQRSATRRAKARRSSDRKSSGSSSRTSTSGSTSATRTHPRWPPTNTRASPQFASGPSSSIPTASVAAPPKSTQQSQKG